MNILLILSLVVVILCSNEDFVPTPIGSLPTKCVIQVPSGSQITELENGNIMVNHTHLNTVFEPLEGCRIFLKRSTAQFPPNYNGWLAYTTFHYPAGISKFLGKFSVPNAPQNRPDRLYIFTGLQNVDWIPIVDPEPTVFDIIQPVLQYPRDDGDGWSLKSWYVTLDGRALHSPEIFLNEGETIFGNLTKIARDRWFIGGTNPTGQTSSLMVSADRLVSQPWAYNTLECYGCKDCTYEATKPVHFTSLAIYDEQGQILTPDWVTHKSPTPRCNEKADVLSPSDVDISFNN